MYSNLSVSSFMIYSAASKLQLLSFTNPINILTCLLLDFLSFNFFFVFGSLVQVEVIFVYCVNLEPIWRTGQFSQIITQLFQFYLLSNSSYHFFFCYGKLVLSSVIFLKNTFFYFWIFQTVVLVCDSVFEPGTKVLGDSASKWAPKAAKTPC